MLADQAKNFSPARVLFFAALLLLPSLDVPLKYIGLSGMAAYFIFGVLGIFVCFYKILPHVVPRVSERTAASLLFCFLLILAAYSLAIYPVADSGYFGGGTDVDDALVIGAKEILAGRYPYYPKTYLGGFLSPMPGALFLALPFVVLGVLPLQNVFWIAVLAITAKYVLRSYLPALLIVLTVFLISPTAYQVLGTASDHISNTIYVLVSMWLLLTAVADRGSSMWVRIFPAVLLGVGLASRSNFLILMPLLFSAIAQAGGWRTALRYCVLAGGVFLAVTLPFWFYDPAGFSPYIVQAGRLHNISTVLPYAPIIIPITSFGIAGLLSMTRMPANGAAFFRNCAVVQLITLYISSLAYAAFLGEFSLFLGNVGYGMFTIFFAAVSACIFVHGSHSVHRPKSA